MSDQLKPHARRNLLRDLLGPPSLDERRALEAQSLRLRGEEERLSKHVERADALVPGHGDAFVALRHVLPEIEKLVERKRPDDEITDMVHHALAESMSLLYLERAATAYAGALRNEASGQPATSVTDTIVGKGPGDAGLDRNAQGYPTRAQIEAERQRRVAAEELYGYEKLATHFSVGRNVIRRRLGRMR